MAVGKFIMKKYLAIFAIYTIIASCSDYNQDNSDKITEFTLPQDKTVRDKYCIASATYISDSVSDKLHPMEKLDAEMNERQISMIVAHSDNPLGDIYSGLQYAGRARDFRKELKPQPDWNSVHSACEKVYPEIAADRIISLPVANDEAALICGTLEYHAQGFNDGSTARETALNRFAAIRNASNKDAREKVIAAKLKSEDDVEKFRQVWIMNALKIGQSMQVLDTCLERFGGNHQ